MKWALIWEVKSYFARWADKVNVLENWNQNEVVQEKPTAKWNPHVPTSPECYNQGSCISQYKVICSNFRGVASMLVLQYNRCSSSCLCRCCGVVYWGKLRRDLMQCHCLFYCLYETVSSLNICTFLQYLQLITKSDSTIILIWGQ